MQDAKIKTQPRLAELGGVKNDRVKMKNSKSETLNSKQTQNSNSKNSKCLSYYLFWILNLGFWICLGFRI